MKKITIRPYITSSTLAVAKKARAALLASVAFGMLANSTMAQAQISENDLTQFVATMTVAANSKNINQIGRLVADDALISVSRKGKTSTLSKSSYLNLLQNNWSKSTAYHYSMNISNVVFMGNQVKADVVTNEVINEQGHNVRLVTTSRATFSEANNGVVLSRAISQLAIEQYQ